jgi:hypothetical protein
VVIHEGIGMLQVEIRVRGVIDETWSPWLGGLSIHSTGVKETLLRGKIPDQAALYGTIARLRDLGLDLISVDCCSLDNHQDLQANQMKGDHYDG